MSDGEENPFIPISLGIRKKSPVPTGSSVEEFSSIVGPSVACKSSPQPSQSSRCVSVQGFSRNHYSGKTHTLYVNKAMCRGEIQRQAGSKLGAEINCGVEAHQQTRMAIPDKGAIFIKVPGQLRTTQVFTNPMVPVDKLSLG